MFEVKAGFGELLITAGCDVFAYLKYYCVAYYLFSGELTLIIVCLKYSSKTCGGDLKRVLSTRILLNKAIAAGAVIDIISGLDVPVSGRMETNEPMAITKKR